MSDSLENKVVVVTGGAGGIGQATCRAFLEAGCRVVIADVAMDAAHDFEKTLTPEEQTRLLCVETDVSEESSVVDLMASVKKQWGQINILVNNAAVFLMKGLEASVEIWDAIWRVNVLGYALCAKHVAPFLRQQVGSSIINIGSISGFIAQPDFLTYGTCKGAISAMTRCLAEELAKDGIRVNAVCPGSVWTPRVAEYFQEVHGWDREAVESNALEGGKYLMHRFAEPEEVARTILFLASSDASFMTAENLMVDGGYLAR